MSRSHLTPTHNITPQDKVDTVLEALSHLELPPTIIIEVFLASSSATLLPKLGTKVRTAY